MVVDALVDDVIVAALAVVDDTDAKIVDSDSIPSVATTTVSEVATE